MDFKMENKKLEDQLKSIVYVAVGAVAEITEKALEMANSFEEKGKQACDKAKASNEELKRDLKESLSKAINVTIIKDKSTDEFVDNMSNLSKDDLAKIKEKLAELENAPAEEPAASEEAAPNEEA